MNRVKKKNNKLLHNIRFEQNIKAFSKNQLRQASFLQLFMIIFDYDNRYVCNNSYLFQSKLKRRAAPAERVGFKCDWSGNSMLVAIRDWTMDFIVLFFYYSGKQKHRLCEIMRRCTVCGDIMRTNARGFVLMIACQSAGNLMELQTESWGKFGNAHHMMCCVWRPIRDFFWRS